MSAETEETRKRAFSLIEKAGWSLSRIGKGQRYVVAINNPGSGTTIKALVKTASRGSAMVKTNSDNADDAKLSGFGDDIDHVLFAVGDPASGSVSAFLVPAAIVEEAYRKAHREWRANRPHSNANTTWVLWFNNGGSPEANGFAEKWKGHLVGTEERPATASGQETLSIAEAKERLARTFGVSPASIKISIEG